jgi:hypothetical protein
MEAEAGMKWLRVLLQEEGLNDTQADAVIGKAGKALPQYFVPKLQYNKLAQAKKQLKTGLDHITRSQQTLMQQLEELHTDNLLLRQRLGTMEADNRILQLRTGGQEAGTPPALGTGHSLNQRAGSDEDAGDIFGCTQRSDVNPPDCFAGYSSGWRGAGAAGEPAPLVRHIAGGDTYAGNGTAVPARHFRCRPVQTKRQLAKRGHVRHGRAADPGAAPAQPVRQTRRGAGHTL